MTMDPPQRTRSCRRDQPAATTSQSRGSRQICLPLDRATYDRIWDDPQAVRILVDDLLSRHPELFPKAMTQGFTLCGTLPPSKKLAGVCLRRVRVTETDENGHATTRDFFPLRRDVAEMILTWIAGAKGDLGVDEPLLPVTDK